MGTMPYYRFRLGALDCLALSDGAEVRPVAGTFKDAPPEELAAALSKGGYPAGETTVYFNNLFIRAGERRILVDAGWGQGKGRRDGTLLESLQAAGIAPADIDTLVITHGDIDHVGGLTTTDGRLVFPNAAYILLQEAWDFWSNTALVARWPAQLTGFGRETLPRLRERLQVVPAGAEFLPGIQLHSAPGHRPGHTVISAASAGQHLLHVSDLIGHPLLMEHPGWVWAFDTRPDVALQDKRAILEQAVAGQAVVFAAHLPFPGVGRVSRQGEGWHWEPWVP